MSCRKRTTSSASSSFVQSAMVPMRIPSAASAGTSSSAQSVACRAVSASTRVRISASIAFGVRPSSERTFSPAAAWSSSPATRTAKNSSMCEEKNAAYFTRSSSGVLSSNACSSTRALQSSRDSSLFNSRPAFFGRRAAAGRAAVFELGVTRLL